MKHVHAAATEALAPLFAQRELCVENVLVVVVLSAASALVATGQLGSDCGHGSGRLLGGRFGSDLAAQFGREVFSSKGREHAVFEAGRQFVGPLRDGRRRNSDGFSGGRNRSAE